MQFDLNPATATIHLKLSYSNMQLFAAQFANMIDTIEREMPTSHNLEGFNLPDELDVNLPALFNKQFLIVALKSALRRFLMRLESLEDKNKTVRISSQKLLRNPQGEICSVEQPEATQKLFLVKMSYTEALAYNYFGFMFDDIFEQSTQTITNKLTHFINQKLSFPVQMIEKEYSQELNENSLRLE